MRWMLEIYEKPNDTRPMNTLPFPSADAARSKATSIRKQTLKWTEMWFKIIDPGNVPYQHSLPSSKWRMKWYPSVHTLRVKQCTE